MREKSIKKKICKEFSEVRKIVEMFLVLKMFLLIKTKICPKGFDDLHTQI